MTVTADVFAGKVTRDFNVEKGFKGQLTLPQGENIYLFVGYDGFLKDLLKESVGKDVVLVGNLRYPGMDAKTRVNILEVTGKVNGGGMVVKRGRLTKDPELKYTQNGKQIVNFNLAVNYGWGDNKETDFIVCKMWGNADKEKNPAVTLAEKGAKGREVIVKGRLEVGKDRDDNPFPTLVVIEYDFIGALKDGNPADNKPVEHRWEDIGTEIEVGEDEIPF